MQLLSGDRTGIIRDIQRSCGIGQKFHGEAQVNRLPCCRVAAHLCHISADDDRVDPQFAQRRFELRIREAARQLFVDDAQIIPLEQFWPKLPALAAFDESGRILLR